MLANLFRSIFGTKNAREMKRIGRYVEAVNALEPVFKRRLPRRYLLTRYDARRRMTDEVEATAVITSLTRLTAKSMTSKH